jgi:3-oxoadipate enol-lactonase
VLEPALVVGASGDEYRASLALSAERYRKAGAEVTIGEFLEARWPGYRSPLEEALPGAFMQAVNDAETWFERELPGLLDWRFGREEARRIGQPTLCLLGGRSAEMGARFEEAHELLLDWLPCAEGHIVSYTTHLMQIENPRATAEALASFWSRHPIPTRPGRHAQ